MITMRNWIVENTVHDSLIGYERDHLARRLDISTDLGPEWALKLDLERDGMKNVVDLEREGDVLYVDLTRDMLAGDGHYRAQLRGLSGEVVRHSNVFWLVVSSSINAIDSFPPLEPTEMAQMEERVTKAKDEAVAAAETAQQYSGKPPIIQNGTWWIWDAESKSYMDTGEAAQGPSGPQGPAGEGRGDMLASVYDPAGKGQDIFAAIDTAIKELKDNPTLVGGIPIATTYTPEGGTDGVDYAADVPGATELFRGLHIIIMPHITSTDVKTNLNVNGLGRKLLRRYLSTSLSGNAAPYSGLPGWIAADKPILLMYTGSYWTVIGNTQPSAGDLNGYVTPDHGGTGLSTIPAGSYLVGNGTESVQTKTPEEVRVDIGAVPPARLTMVTLMADGWTENVQTISVPGVLADETKQAITPSPSPESWEAAGKAMVRCTGQGADSLTFMCKSAPVENLSYYVVIQEVVS